MSEASVLAKIQIWADNAIKDYGAIDVLGHLKQYLNELERNIHPQQDSERLKWMDRAWLASCAAESAQAGESAALDMLGRMRQRLEEQLEAFKKSVRELEP